jgi:hypothetical protein
MPSSVVESILSVPAPSLIPDRIGTLSDDECMRRLADAVEAHDSGQLDELARLLGRLAVVIE